MLNVLRRITQEVSTAAELGEALTRVVRHVREALAVDVCSVYLVEETQGDYVLMATDGLQAAVGQLRAGSKEGLVGWVGARREPLTLDHAPQHPRYGGSPETGGKRFEAFLGVPILRARRVVGVLVAQQRQSRLFSEDEVTLLLTIAAQLGGVVSAGLRGGEISPFKESHPPANVVIQGIAGAPGVAIGTVLLPSPLANLESIPDRKSQDVVAEEAAFRAAVAALQQELDANSARLNKSLSHDARQIFDFYKLLLDGDGLVSDILECIRAGNWAPGALRETVLAQVQLFERMEDRYLQARAEDIRGIGRRLLMYLHADEWQPRTYPKRCILVGEEISVARLADVPVGQLAGLVCARGSVLSHTAILARALGIPAVMGVGALPRGNLEGCEMVVDGYRGRVILEPWPAVRREFQRLVRSAQKLSGELEALRSLPAETTDGLRIPLYANTGLLAEIAPALDSGAEGVGLYRTEFAFMLRAAFPSEEEQYQVYRSLLEAFAPRPVTMRTLDVGGDKSLPYFPLEEANPFLGWRGIRFLLDQPELLLTQLRAMLRANTGLNNLQILLPMITTYREVDAVRALLAQAYGALREKTPSVVLPRLGVMLEVPATLYQMKALARRVDFFSLGTNDLTQYLLAVDRNNARVAGLYDSLHPAVIGAIRAAVRQAHRYGKPISVCGEMAADPRAVILLMGLGVDALSMAAPNIPRIKWVIRTFSQRRAQQLLAKVLRLEAEHNIHRLLQEALAQAGLGALVSSTDSGNFK